MYGWDDCKKQAEEDGLGPLRSLLICLPVAWDAAWRKRDFQLQRGYGGLGDRFGLKGHPPIALGVFALLLYFLILGPTMGPAGLAPVTALFMTVMLVVVAGHRSAVNPLWLHLVALLFVSAGMWWWAGPDSSQASGGPYRHVLLVLVPLVVIPLLVAARFLAGLLVDRIPKRYRSVFQRNVTKVELFQRPEYHEVTLGSVVRSLINAPLRHPIMLAYLPAVAVVAAVPSDWLLFWSVALLVLAWLLLSFATVHPRLDSMLDIVRGALFRGGQLGVSIAIVVFAVGRWADVGYVSTVVESSRGKLFGFRPGLITLMLAGYSFFWFYEYWLNRIMSERLLSTIQSENDPPGQASYWIERRAAETSVPLDGRVIQIHGAGRFVALGEPTTAGKHPSFQFYHRNALFNRIAGAKGGNAAVDLRGRTRSYFTTMNLLLLGFGVALFLVLKGSVQKPEIVAVPGSTGSFELRNAIYASESDSPRRVLLAASGGGTRAALYTVSVLKGLSEVGALGDLVLASGVSGGGAALAYYAGRREELGATDDRAWERFLCTMDDPFIWDVLDGALEWRIAAGDRLGNLLAESLDRRFGGGAETFGDVHDLGLILNTTLAGHLRIDSVPVRPSVSGGEQPTPCRLGESFEACARENARFTRSSPKGGRLIFTNLASGGAFASRDSDPSFPARLDYVVVADASVSLARAAAANANFPPVFSNAAIDLPGDTVRSVFGGDRYWVTDGGAADNRGLVSLLLALRHAAQEELNEPRGRRVPDIHIVMAEASGGSSGYSQDRGIGSLFGASTKFANQVIEELLGDIRHAQDQLSQGSAGVYLHYLEMPAALRTDGGLGTHWMLPERVSLGAAAGDDVPPFSGLTVRDGVFALHRGDPSTVAPVSCLEDRGRPADETTTEIQRFWSAIDAEGYRSAEWRGFREAWMGSGTRARSGS